MPKPKRPGERPLRLAAVDRRGRFERIFGIKRIFLIGLLVAFSVLIALATQRLRAASAASRLGASLVPVRFAPAIGWHLRRNSVHACPGVSASRCSQVTSLASTIRWRKAQPLSANARCLFVWFGRSKPTAHQLRRANAELRRARLG